VHKCVATIICIMFLRLCKQEVKKSQGDDIMVAQRDAIMITHCKNSPKGFRDRLVSPLRYETGRTASRSFLLNLKLVCLFQRFNITRSNAILLMVSLLEIDSVHFIVARIFTNKNSHWAIKQYFKYTCWKEEKSSPT
jgi:hypothetical protein